MSDELTVRQAIARLETFDPDMTVTELRRRLTIAERVLVCHQSGRQIDVGWNCYDRADDLWLWLTREEDQ